MKSRSGSPARARRAFHGVLSLLAIAVLSLHGARRLAAAPLAISPTVNVVPTGKPAADFELRNLGTTPVTVQADAVRWSQAQGEDHFTPATRLLIVPPLFTIPPGSSQIVRIAPQAPGKDQEKSYRVNFRELPPPPPPGFYGVRLTLDLNVPLFFTPPQARPSLALTVQLTAKGTLQLRASNGGSEFARMTDVTLRDAGGHIVADLKGPLYVLPASWRAWSVRAAPAVQRGEKLTADVASGLSHREIPLVIE